MDSFVVGFVWGTVCGFAFMASAVVVAVYLFSPRKYEGAAISRYGESQEASFPAPTAEVSAPVAPRGPKSRTMWDLPEKPAKGA